MPTDNPYPSPAPIVLVQMLRIHAWADELDDDSRKFHEWSADCLEQMIRANGVLAGKVERLEHQLDVIVKAAYRQKGGAA